MANTKPFRLTRLPKGKALGISKAQAHLLITTLLAINHGKPAKQAKQDFKKHEFTAGPIKDTSLALLQHLKHFWAGKHTATPATSKKR